MVIWDQGKRLRVLRDLKTVICVLVATDVAARIDISGVDLCLQLRYSCYVHRIGLTKVGSQVSLSLCCAK